jgi:hypothetical protein
VLAELSPLGVVSGQAHSAEARWWAPQEEVSFQEEE